MSDANTDTPAITPDVTPEVPVVETEIPEAKVVPLETLKKSEKEARDLKRKLEGYEAAAEAARLEQLSEADRAREEAAAAQAQLQELRTQVTMAGRQNAVMAAAQKAGYANPDDALAFVKLDVAEAADEDEARSILEAAVAQVLVARPYLAGPSSEPVPGRVGGSAMRGNGGTEVSAADENDPNARKAWRSMLNGLGI